MLTPRSFSSRAMTWTRSLPTRTTKKLSRRRRYLQRLRRADRRRNNGCGNQPPLTLTLECTRYVEAESVNADLLAACRQANENRLISWMLVDGLPGARVRYAPDGRAGKEADRGCGHQRSRWIAANELATASD